MILAWLIEHTAPYRALKAQLDAETVAHAATRVERDDYRKRFIDQCEYSAIAEGKPRFGAVNPTPHKQKESRVTSIAEVSRKRQKALDDKFNTWLNDHPEEKMRAQQLREREGLVS